MPRRVIPDVTLTLVDGVRVVVPDSLDLITSYVLREQHDWFEDEIKFLRRLLQSGQKAVDVGANCGVYTLCMARAVGPAGHVWAFEPASSTARLLAAGVQANGYTQVSVEQAALSSTRGTAQLSLEANSEMNALVHAAAATGANETVDVSTLDESMRSYGWHDIDFVKIDAEGEEANILKGGACFLSECSPLVQYEIKAGVTLHMELVRAFAERGYSSYRLIPGLDVLVPFDAGARADPYLLNLFCCKSDRADALASLGRLVRIHRSAADRGEGWLARAWNLASRRRIRDWQNTLARRPYAVKLAGLWKRTLAAGKSGEVVEALMLHARSRDYALPPAERYDALASSYTRLRALCERAPSHLRLSSFARVAHEYGERKYAVDALAQLYKGVVERKEVDFSEPFLPPGERFDTLEPGEALGKWLQAAVLEELERLGSFSSFYTGASARQRLQTIRDLGFASAEMQRRLDLVQRRFPVAA